MINDFVRSVVNSRSKVSQICIGNGNVQCRGDIIDGKIMINGKNVNLEDGAWVDDENIKGNVTIKIIGDVHKIDIPIGDVSVQGNVTGDIHTAQGDIEIGGNVEGEVKSSMGNITIKGKHSGGSVKTSMGDVSIGE
jgi:hypothetical protein